MVLKLGVSGTNMNDQQFGMLKTLAGSAEAGQQAMNYANQLYPDAPEADPWEAAFQFFSAMGQAASQPGATVLGSAVGSMQVPMDYLAAKKKEKTETDRARLQTAVQLAPSLKPKVTTGSMSAVAKLNADLKAGRISQEQFNAAFAKLTNIAGGSSGASSPLGKLAEDLKAGIITQDEYDAAVAKATNIAGASEGNFTKRDVFKGDLKLTVYSKEAYDKALSDDETEGGWSNQREISNRLDTEKQQQGNQASYLSPEDAKALLTSDAFKFEENSPEYLAIFNQITTDDEEMLGQPVIIGQQFVNYYFNKVGGEVKGIILKTPQGSSIPSIVKTSQKEYDRLSKISIEYIDKVNDLVPTLESTMAVIMQNPNLTGKWQEATYGIRAGLSSAFGYDSEEVTLQSYLESMSNKLAPKMRPVGSGSTSDMEFKAYKKAILDLGNTPLANYLTMHSLKQITINNANEIELRKQLLQQNKSAKYISEKVDDLNETKTKIFQNFSSEEFDTGDDAVDTLNYTNALDAWWDSLPYGSVIVNEDPHTGQKMFPTVGSFAVKGWGEN